MSQKIWGWIIFALGIGGYVSIGIGGWLHPVELNMATYSLWAMLSVTLFFSMYLQKHEGWYMPLSWIFGNVFLVVLAAFLPESTFNLGQSEAIVLYGLVTVIGTWVVVGQVTKRWNHRILFWGSIITDVLSFYPQLKQYLLPHEPPTLWLLMGWACFLLSVSCNLFLLGRLFFKLRPTDEKRLSLAEESALSIENIVLIIITIVVMMR